MPNENARPIERVLESFERLTADISSRFSYIPIDELPGAIESALCQLVETLDVDRSTVFELVENGVAVKMLHFWARPGVAPMRLGDVEGLSWYIGRLRQGEAIRIGEMERDLPPEAESEQAYVRAVGMKSNLTIPAFIGGQLVCALAVGSFRDAREWPDPLVERVRLVAQIIAAALLRRSQELALRASLDEIERLNRQLRAENLYLHEELKSRHDFDEIVGNSGALSLVLARVEQVAATQSTVLLLGESGTGKALFAHAIHARSPRRQRPFVEVNCAALPAGLIESELFGHEKGAFTGAVAQRLGRFEVADGGTLFLDEVADLPLDLQGRLLRVLQEGEFERVGSSRTRHVDVRVVAATNQDLEAAVRAGRFRVDLYYRLSVFPIVLPPLRDRTEDIPPLLWFFVTRLQRRMGRHIERVPRASMDALQHYHWPGNVRELQNVVERAMIRSTGDVLEIDESFDTGRRPPMVQAADRTLAAVERAHITAVLDECGWRINGPGGAAETLALNPNTLRFRMKKLAIDRSPDRQVARSQDRKVARPRDRKIARSPDV
jgi:formate hydrogenlyase transcriptional activator